MQPTRLLAFIKPTGDEGPILEWRGGDVVAEEFAQAGHDTADHSFPVPDGRMRGLLIFEGWLEWTSGPEPDSMFVGEWRMLSMWELSRVRFGLSPFDDAAEARKWEDPTNG